MKLTYKEVGLVAEETYTSHLDTLKPYIGHVQDVASKNTYDYDEGSINCPFDTQNIEKVEAVVSQKVTDELAYVIVIGIGGSNLGTKAIYDALYGHFDGLEQMRMPKVVFVDTTNSRYITKLQKFLSEVIKYPEEILFVTISKSGGTAETIANTEMLLGEMQKTLPEVLDRTVVITDYGSKLFKIAQEKSIAHLTIPQKVGGRFSVFSAVGLFPLAAMGIDIREMLTAAQQMRDKCLLDNLDENYALASAITLYTQLQTGHTIHDTFVFNPELESLGKWYRQLLGESIGKQKDVDGHIVHVGLTPTVSVGSVDLHSVAQLYLGGPKDKVTTFVSARVEDEDIVVPTERLFQTVEMISGKSAAQIMDAIKIGTQIAYKNARLPYMNIDLKAISAAEIGAFMQFKMLEVMYLANLLHINAFDQPNVELYKIETKRILEGE